MTCCLPCPYNPNICDDGGISASYRAPVLNLDATNIDNMSTTANSSTSTTAWTDLSGNGNNGTLTNFANLNPPTATSGWDGTNTPANPSVLKFDGVDDYVDAGTSNLLTGAHSVAFWAYTSASGNVPFFEFQLDSLGYISYKDSSGRVMHGHRGGIQPYTNNNTFSLNQWNHIVFTYNGGSKSASSSYKIYINGSEQAVSLPYGPIGSSFQRNYIGRERNAYGNSRINNLQIYNTALSAFQIYQTYLAESSRFAGAAATSPLTFMCNALLVPPPQPQVSTIQTPATTPPATPTPTPTSTATPAPVQNITNSGSSSPSQESNIPPPPAVNSLLPPTSSNATPQTQPTPFTQEQIDKINTVIKSGMVIDIGLIQKNINIPTGKPPAVKTDSAPYIDLSKDGKQ